MEARGGLASCDQRRGAINQMLKTVGAVAIGVWVLEPVEVWNQCPVPEAGTRMI